MKPDWKNAPKWAKWLAMDMDGEWCWFYSKPFVDEVWQKWGVLTGRHELARLDKNLENPGWRETLEQRPE